MVDAYMAHRAQIVRSQAVRSQVSWWTMYLGLISVSAALGMFMLTRGPSLSLLAWLFYMAGVVAIFYEPRYGVYLLAGLTMFGDSNLHSWYPFTKNLSSRESLMYISDGLIISPLEIFIVLTLLVWLGRMGVQRRIRINIGPLTWPALLFLCFVTYGLLYGLSRGGNQVIALWEARSIYYLLAMLILTGNLIETRRQTNLLFWIITIGLFLKGISGVIYAAVVLHWDIGSVERIAEHSMSIHFNLFFVLMIAAWLYRDALPRRLFMPMMALPVLYSFFANHRRAGFLTIGLAVLLIVLLLYRENRKLFWAITPTGAIAFVGYLAVFWNSNSAIGIIARAVRSVIGQPTARDAASNIYRDIENLNIMFTIRQVPLQGLGFGQKFYIPYPMPDISTFEWWEYITHNSIMWVWMQIGAGGFFALLMMVGMAMLVGGRLIWTMPRGEMRGYALAATLYILMHFTYAFVDMSWDISSMVLVGTMMGVLNSLDLISARPVHMPDRRWPWQPESSAFLAG